MWHRNDGGEDPGEDGAEIEPSGSPLPDPETRYWRHPSELRRHHALPHPDPTPMPTGPFRGTSSMLWPLVVVGGCLTVAAVGVLSMGRGSFGPATLESGPETTALPEWAIELPTAVTGSGADRPSATDSPTSAGPEPSALADRSSTIPTPAEELSELTSRSRPSPGGTPTTATDMPAGLLPAEAEETPVLGIYGEPSDRAGLLASLVIVDGELVTSAGAIDGRPSVWVRAGSAWFEASVTATDPLTDVALLDPIAGPDEVALPALPPLPVSPEPVAAGDPVMIGYGRTEAPAAGTGTAAGDGHWVDGWVRASDRRGRVYALEPAVSTAIGHLVNDPIRAAIDRRPGDAGAPLRDPEGRLVGMTVSGSIPVVTAVPIDRVVEAVGALRRYSTGDGVWLGLDVLATGRGLIVIGVDDDGPAAAIRPGDRIAAVDDRTMTHPDELRYAARRAGPGGTLAVTIERDGRRSAIEFVIELRSAAG